MSTENLSGHFPRRTPTVYESPNDPTGSDFQPGDRWINTVTGQVSDFAGGDWVEAVTSASLDAEVEALETALDGKADTNHTHVLADITDAGSAAGSDVEDFAAASHTHVLADITDAGTAAGSDTGDFAAAVHTHAPSDITGLTASAAELNVLDGIPGTLTATELGYCDGVTSGIQGQLDGKAASSHSHAASDITSGVFDQARLGSGSSGAGTKVLYDDQTFKTPASGGVNTANSPAAGEFAKFTDADTIEGRTVAELLGDISGGSGLTSTQLGYVAGVTSALQTQLAGKLSSTPVFCIVSDANVQTITYSTDTRITWDTEIADANGFHSTGTNPSRITPSAGTYLFFSVLPIKLTADTYSKAAAANFWKNGSATGGVKAAVGDQTSIGNNYWYNFSVPLLEIIACNGTDYVEVNTISSSGSASFTASVNGSDPGGIGSKRSIFGCIRIGD